MKICITLTCVIAASWLATASVDAQCVDDPAGWYDKDGTVYNCNWYDSGNNCQMYGDDYENMGKTANEVSKRCTVTRKQTGN